MAAIRTLLPLALLLPLGGCAASKYYDAAVLYRPKNAHAALEYVSLCLKADPNHAEARALALDIGRSLAADSATKLQQYEADQAYEDAVKECDRMVVSADLCAKMGNIDVFYDTEIGAKMAEKAAQQFYERGVSLEGQDWKEAALAFQRVNGFKSGFKDSAARFTAAAENAMTKLALPPFKVESQDGSELAAQVTQKMRGAMGKFEWNFIRLASDNAPSNGRISGKIVAGYEDSGWQSEDRSYEHSEPQWAKDANGYDLYDAAGNRLQATDSAGNLLYDVYRASWTVFSRETAGSATISFDVVLSDGSTPVSGSEDCGGRDSVMYRSQINGDEEAVRQSPNSGDLDLPAQKREPSSPGSLILAGIDGVTQKLARRIFDHYE